MSDSVMGIQRPLRFHSPLRSLGRCHHNHLLVHYIVWPPCVACPIDKGLKQGQALAVGAFMHHRHSDSMEGLKGLTAEIGVVTSVLGWSRYWDEWRGYRNSALISNYC